MVGRPVRASERAQIAQLPAIGLTRAIESVRALWRGAEASQVTPEVAAVTLGYRRLGPQVRKRLSAFRAYGLIDQGPGVRLTDLALTIMRLENQHQEGSGAYLEAVRTAALRPRIFREMFRSHGRASYEALRSHLIAQLGLPSTTARTFIAAFRETLAAGRFVAAESSGPQNGHPPREKPDPPSAADEPHDERVRVFRWLLSKHATAELRLFGSQLTSADLDRLRQYVDLARAALGGSDRRPEYRSSLGGVRGRSRDRRSASRRRGR
jgi:hypothetical protein